MGKMNESKKVTVSAEEKNVNTQGIGSE